MKHDLKLLFDGECPLCVKEVNFLKSRNEKGLIAFVDLADLFVFTRGELWNKLRNRHGDDTRRV